MITIRKSADRGHIEHSWLDTYHTFSFGRYYDRNHMGFGPLRVINEDRVLGGKGFDTHPHDNMEIVTYVLEGALAHKDSMGNGSTIRPGDVQRMSAGTGVTHSEYNPSETDPVHLLQIWFLPEKENIPPGYAQKGFAPEGKQGRLQLLVSREGRDGSLSINQDIDMYAAVLGGNDTIAHALKPGRLGWLQVAKGSLDINGQALAAGDGAAIRDEAEITLSGAKEAEIVLFDMTA
ncbi:MAG: pirin family protein [Alphaproteobacteria bacterium]|nr:pirin family protein [Alphaproteobacteria bacterium]